MDPIREPKWGQNRSRSSSGADLVNVLRKVLPQEPQMDTQSPLDPPPIRAQEAPKRARKGGAKRIKVPTPLPDPSGPCLGPIWGPFWNHLGGFPGSIWGSILWLMSGLCWEGFSQVSLWFLVGFSNVSLKVLPGFSLGCAWFRPGFSQASQWFLPRSSPVSFRFLLTFYCGSSRGSSRSLKATRPGVLLGLPRLRAGSVVLSPTFLFHFSVISQRLRAGS